MMGLFSAASAFDADVEKATNEKNTSDDWATIMEICDKVSSSPTNSKECLKSIVKRLNNPDPHVVLQVVTLLDACVNNCGKTFHLEIASREFEQELRKLISKSQPKIADKFKYLLKKWAEGEFKSDPQLNLIPAFYNKLKQEGIDFTMKDTADSKGALNNSKSKDLSIQREVDDIAKAIELSLKDSKASNPVSKSVSHSLYPSTNNVSSMLGKGNAPPSSNVMKEKQLVKALYDFEAVEDNELTFYNGEIIEVLDDSDKNWWRGCSHRGEGLFPANFVTTDLTALSESEKEKEKSGKDSAKKSHVQFNENVTNHENNDAVKDEDIYIDESKIDRLLNLLHEANPTDDSADTEEMLKLEAEVNAMSPLIDAELENTDMKHAQLTQLSSSLVDAFNLYHSLMREPFNMPHAKTTSHIPPGAHQVMYNGAPMSSNYSLPPSQQQAYGSNNTLPQPTMGGPAPQYIILPTHPQRLTQMMPPAPENDMHNHHSLPSHAYQRGIPMSQFGQPNFLPSSGTVQQMYHQQPNQSSLPSQSNKIHQ